MNAKYPGIVLGVLLLLISACDRNDVPDPKPQSGSINKILPLGASRVQGARPAFESYRYELWKDLTENGWTFDFIGTQTDEASYPAFLSNDFDPDHEGRGGWTSGQILNGLEDWLDQTGPPDVVLLSSPGGNDALEDLSYTDAVENIYSIIDILQANNPNVTIIIEQMAPGHSSIMTADLNTYFEQLQEDVSKIATEKTTSESLVIAVDMFTAFSDGFLEDDVHYNEAGAEFIAERYYQVLENVLES